jgi:hypothetical protein
VTCSGSGTTGVKTEKWLFQNWARTQRVLVPVVYNPTSVAEIVAAEVEGRQETAKAIGSQWAYGGVAVDDTTQNVINTQLLCNKLNNDDPTKGIIPFALRDHLKKRAKFYVHVEAALRSGASTACWTRWGFARCSCRWADWASCTVMC